MALIQKIPYPPTFLKRTPASPLKGSLYWRALGPAIVVSHNGPKNQNTWGIQGGHPWRLFPRSYSISLGQMRKHLRGPGQARMISTAFDPAFLSTRKGVARRSNLAITCQSFIRSCHKAHAVLWHLLSLCGERRQRRRIICRFSPHENRRQRYHLNHPIQIGAAAPGILVVIISSYILHPNQYSYFETNNM